MYFRNIINDNLNKKNLQDKFHIYSNRLKCKNKQVHIIM